MPWVVYRPQAGMRKSKVSPHGQGVAEGLGALRSWGVIQNDSHADGGVCSAPSLSTCLSDHTSSGLLLCRPQG